MSMYFIKSSKQNSIGITFDIFNQGKVCVGFFEFHVLPEYPDVIEIDRLYIKNLFQKQGIGSFVVQSIFWQFKPKSIIALCITTDFWCKIGFKKNEHKWGHNYYECKDSEFIKKHII